MVYSAINPKEKCLIACSRFSERNLTNSIFFTVFLKCFSKVQIIKYARIQQKIKPKKNVVTYVFDYTHIEINRQQLSHEYKE